MVVLMKSFEMAASKSKIASENYQVLCETEPTPAPCPRMSDLHGLSLPRIPYPPATLITNLDL